jgi:hypothetical protein
MTGFELTVTALCVLWAGPPRTERPARDRDVQGQTAPADLPAERWFSITQGTELVGVMRLAYTQSEGGFEYSEDIALPMRLFALFRGQTDVRIPEEQARAPVSSSSIATLNANGEFVSGRDSISAPGMSLEAAIQRQSGVWIIQLRQPDGSVRQIRGSPECASYTLPDALWAYARTRRLAPGARFALKVLRAEGDLLLAIEWQVEVGQPEAIAAGGLAQVEVFPLAARTRLPGRGEDMRWTLWVDAQGRICKARLPVQGAEPLVFEWKKDRREANGGSVPFLRRGRGDIFDRSRARRLPEAGPVRDPVERLAALERDTGRALADRNVGTLQALRQQAETFLQEVLSGAVELNADQRARLDAVVRQLRQAVPEDLEELLTRQFDALKAQLDAALGAGKMSDAERVIDQMRAIANNPGLSAERRAGFAGSVEEAQDRKVRAEYTNRLLEKLGPDSFRGYIVNFGRPSFEPVRVAFSLLGCPLDWREEIPVHWPRAHIAIGGRVYAEGCTADLGVGDPVEIYRIETDRVVFRVREREIPIPYPVGGEGGGGKK